jgi:hypothetical protein
MIRQRQFLTRHRHRIALLAVFGVLSFAVAAEHSGLGHTEDAAEHIGTAVVSMCLAVLTVASTVAAFVAARLRRAVTRPVRVLGLPSLVMGLKPPTRPPRERAGPLLFRVLRR